MAGNSIFTSQKRKFPYTTGGESSSNIKQPLKRIKSKENVAGIKADEFDEWDDDLSLTQQELTDLDVAASQAYVQKTSPQPGTNQAPPNLPAPSKPTPHQSRGPLQNEPNVFIPPLVRQGSSTSSSSTYPPSSSTYESCSSTSSNGSMAPPQLTRKGSITTAPGAQRITPGATASLPSNLIAELEHLRDEMKKYEVLKGEMYMKEGQIKFLRENLQQREQEVAQLHQEKMHEDKRERSEKEKTLKTDVDRLSVEVQFKNQEIRRLREKCLEARPSSNSSFDTSTLVGGTSSPKVRRILVEKPSPHCSTPTKIKEEKSASFSSPQKSIAETSVNNKVKRNCSLRVYTPKGDLHGSQMMSQLLQNSSNATESLPLSNSGTNIVPLLHLHTTLDFQGVKFCRDANNFLLSPVAKSGADIQKIVDTSDKKRSFVSNMNLNLAMYGISQLLTTQGVFSGRQLVDTTAETAGKYPCPSLLLLPLVAEYLNQYSEQLSIQLLDTRSSPSNSGTAGSSSVGGSWKTSSVESSLESLGSSLNLLLQVRSDLANNLEHLTLTALRVLFKLASFSAGLRWALLTLDSSPDTEKLVCSLICSLTMTTPDKKNSSPKVGASFSGCLSQLDIERLELLSKLFKLANPAPEMLCNPNIVNESLNLLILLAKSAIPDQLERFEPAVSRGILCHSLGPNATTAVQLRGLQLLQVLVRSPRIIASLCTDVELCPLTAMYAMVTKLVKDSSAETQIYLTVIDILDTINSEQTSGVSSLFNTRCPCNMECVKCCVTMLYDLLENHQSNCVNENSPGTSCIDSNDTMQCKCLSVLCKGILLLHSISQRDQHFEYRYQDVVHKYTILVSRLQLIMEQDEEQWKTDICALKELWEFVLDPDSSMEEDESQTETEANMETT